MPAEHEAQRDEPFLDDLDGLLEWAAKVENTFRTLRLRHAVHECLAVWPAFSRNSLVSPHRAHTYS